MNVKSKERKSSKLLALLLALAMVVTYMPVMSCGVYAGVVDEPTVCTIERSGSTFASYTSIKDALASASDTDTIKLTTNTNENVTVNSGKTVTLDLNGYVLKASGTNSVIYNIGTLTIKDTNADKPEHKFATSSSLWTWDETNGTVTVKGGCITGGKAAFGGGIQNYGTLTVNGVNIVGNTALASGNDNCAGGGICSSSVGSKMKLIDCNIAGNTAESFGGGIYIWNGDVVVSGTNIANNAANYTGGIYVETADVTITGSTISGNTATWQNGGIANVRSTLTCIGCDIENNAAERDQCGGIGNFGSLTLGDGTVVKNNTSVSEYPSAGVYNWSDEDVATLTINGKVIIKDNKTNCSGTDINANLCLSGSPTNLVATIEGAALAGSEIGVSTMKVDVVGAYTFASDANAAADATYFTSDDDAYYVKADGSKLMLVDLSTKKSQTISFGGGNVAATYGDGNYVRTVSDAKTEVRYSSSNPNVAVVDPQSGTVKINNVGTTVITATAAEDDNYESATASYTLTVSPKVVNVKADNKTSYVGEDLSPLTYSADELIGDDCFTGNLATTASKNVGGEYKITQGSLAINDGNKGANYTIKFQDGTYTVTDSEAEAGLFVKGTLYNKKAIRITWSEPKDQLIYKVFFTKCNSNKWKCVKTTTTATAYNKKGLKAKTNYKMFVASYDDNGNLVEMSPIIHVATGGSKYSNATKVTSSVDQVEMKAGDSTFIEAKVAKKSSKKTLLWKNHCAKIRYYSADNDVATVDADGTVTAVGHGIVNIYAVAPSGAYAVTTVKVVK